MGRKLADEIEIERLGKARIGNGRRESGGIQVFGGCKAFRKPGAEGEQRDLGAFLDDAALADLKRQKLRIKDEISTG